MEMFTALNSKCAKIKVFDDIERTDNSPKRNRESDFEFYNRSSDYTMHAVRKFIESCIVKYPKSDVQELISRLRSGDNVHFKSASFELFIHEALIRQGFEVTTHPELLNGSTNKPDFFVKDKSGEAFYLEAVLASENNELDRGGESRKGVVFDALSVSPHQNFMILIDDDGAPNTPPSSKKLIKEIHTWLDSLNPDEISEKIQNEGIDSIVPLNWRHDNWDLQIRPFPLKPERRGKSTNLIGISGIGAGWLDSWTPIRDAVKYKGRKYGVLDKPLVVAVNLDSFHIDRVDEMQALFGQEEFLLQGGGKEPIMQRAPNGAWYGKAGPQYTRVSAVWIFSNLHASSLSSRKSTIYLNPWANIQIPGSLKCFTYASALNGQMCWNEGLSFRDVFELHDNWPQ
jgi:hypothetical protein